MRLRWLGITGVMLLLASLVLTLVGPQIWSTAYFGVQARATPGGMMGGNGMLQEMMSSEVGGDPTQPFDPHFLNQGAA